MPEPLSSRQRALLRSRANALKPLVLIGKEGVTEAAVKGLAEAFQTRDLLKVKVLETAPAAARDVAHALAAEVENVTVVQVMGRVATLYRPLPPREG